MPNYPIPQAYKKYFWDCDFDQLNMADHGLFIAERILNFGNRASVSWLLGQLDKNALSELLESSRNLDKKTRNYWRIMLDE
ncbi:hypothetical protein GF406_10175 [candidate division KSB1 bacterium]|jgi:hypothetical protein|nr:hypothetical protein [candidate division KSB1 bacterium]